MIPSFQAPDVEWFYLAPLMVVLLTGVVGLLVEAFVPQKVRRVTQLTMTLTALVAAFVLLVRQWGPAGEGGPPSVEVLNGSYVLGLPTLFLQLTVVALTFLSVIVVADRSAGAESFAPAAGAVPGSDYEELARSKNMIQTEVYPLVLFAAGGMMIFPAAGDFMVMFIGLEILSLPLYVLTAMARHRRLLSQEASLKYFLLGAFASAIFLFGITLVYGYVGSLNFNEIALKLAIGGSVEFQGMMWVFFVGLLFTIAGAVFKVGAVPFHQWTPDVYQGAPTPITGFMAACTKVAAFGAILKLLHHTLLFMSAEHRETFIIVLWVLAIATMIVGSVGAIVQHDVKRLLAYSSIAHAGFVLVGITAINEAGIVATLFYMAAYGVATIGAFAIVQLVRETSTSRNGKDVVLLGEATHLSQWAGLGQRNPWLAGAFALFLLSFAGVPLTGGFIGKYLAFTAAIGVGGWVLALVGVLASAISVFFYVRIIVLMYFVKPQEEDTSTLATSDDSAAPAPSGTAATVSLVDHDDVEAGVGLKVAATPVRSTSGVIAVSGDFGIRIVVLITALGTIALGVFPGPVIALLEDAAKFLP